MVQVWGLIVCASQDGVKCGIETCVPQPACSGDTITSVVTRCAKRVYQRACLIVDLSEKYVSQR